MNLACPEGFEPPTHSLEGCCSIRLSYGQIELPLLLLLLQILLIELLYFR